MACYKFLIKIKISVWFYLIFKQKLNFNMWRISKINNKI